MCTCSSCELARNTHVLQELRVQSIGRVHMHTRVCMCVQPRACTPSPAEPRSLQTPAPSSSSSPPRRPLHCHQTKPCTAAVPPNTTRGHPPPPRFTPPPRFWGTHSPPPMGT